MNDLEFLKDYFQKLNDLIGDNKYFENLIKVKKY